MAYDPDFSYVQEIFKYTYTFGLAWLVPLALMFLAMLVITRDTEKWKIMAFPMSILFWAMGMNGSAMWLLIMIIAGVIFVIEALSTQVIGNIIQSVVGKKVDRPLTKKIEQQKIGDLARRVRELKLKKQLEGLS